MGGSTYGSDEFGSRFSWDPRVNVYLGTLYRFCFVYQLKLTSYGYWLIVLFHTTHDNNINDVQLCLDLEISLVFISLRFTRQCRDVEDGDSVCPHCDSDYSGFQVNAGPVTTG